MHQLLSDILPHQCQCRAFWIIYAKHFLLLYPASGKKNAFPWWRKRLFIMKYYPDKKLLPYTSVN